MNLNNISVEEALIDEMVVTGNLPKNLISELNSLKDDYINICGFSPDDAEQAAINTIHVEFDLV